ncbi:MAG: cytochrome C oxidase subunit IV family protein [Flavobacteriaceae bacterium]|jgi:cytochrome c oxidase subunit IV|nr:cytochrome C oxidase subunit IV family protein [Flavobacteriaceae bacterium]MBT4113112.1 cytochrome C oxidase subunit IV family protein [Flavobacteriaceae bacterium]MBT4613897.1 cytochrome C oxidase subunit IV family protein [Flavobacteriaceae bacterium]MBT5246141.1 cytochrome C oxidase subunit IV family protein [Flavobacteriaceae bacterium]MBT5650592.1 cytochrome C oxidase subunit IV family protein [Flavobacteriaceae bacterium]
MSHQVHNLELFRGLIKFKNITQKIWGVLILLSIVTLVEVALGIFKPKILLLYFLNMKILNWIFISLTIVKAYYITWDFMHMRDETKTLRRVVVWTFVFLVLYLIFILIQESGYIFDQGSDDYIKRDF